VYQTANTSRQIGPKLHCNTKSSQQTTWNTKLFVLANLACTGTQLGGGVIGTAAPGGKTGGKVNILDEKLDFLHSAHFKLLCQINGNSINDCDLVHNFC
jgi:hypothetical protein